ncbi:hypothetical protein WJX84_008511, partial [Apatococcus fuscideae]
DSSDVANGSGVPDGQSEGNDLINRLVGGGSGKLQRSPSSGAQAPVCLICLDNLTSEDFESGEAMALECQCRGELALRHRSCAIKWTRVKGDNICDICKAPISNLPQVSPARAHRAQRW